MNTKDTYFLIGNKNPIPDWVVTVKQRPDLTFSFNGIDDPLISASPWPLLHSNQLPLSWAENNPGFPILLRDYSLQTGENKPWIYLPSLPHHPTPKTYRLRTPMKASVKRTLIILKLDQMKEAEATEAQFPEREFKYLFLDRPARFLTTDPKEFKKEHYCFQTTWLPDSVISLAFGEKETYTPYHLHSLHLGACLEQTPQNEKFKTGQSKQCWYGFWELCE